LQGNSFAKWHACLSQSHRKTQGKSGCAQGRSLNAWATALLVHLSQNQQLQVFQVLQASIPRHFKTCGCGWAAEKRGKCGGNEGKPREKLLPGAQNGGKCCPSAEIGRAN